MKKKRVIGRLDVKGANVIKGIHLEGLRVVGNPRELARDYYLQGIDELLYMDAVASLYGRNNLTEVVRAAACELFVPLTVGGGVRTLDDIHALLRAGADKVAINSALVTNPELVTEAAQVFGSQCIVTSVDAKKIGTNKWEVFTESGREKTGLDAIEWCQEMVRRGCGELLITSIDQEGTKKGFDNELISAISTSVSVPVVASGGAGSIDDVIDCFQTTSADAVALASVLHYRHIDLGELKVACGHAGIPVRGIDG